jgi:predicted Zn-dependent peptidase
MFSDRFLQAITLLLLSFWVAGCPRTPKMPSQSGIGGLLAYEYGGIEVLHQYSDRDFVHIRLHFGWQPSLETSRPAQMLAVEGAFTCGAGRFSALEFASKLEAIGAEMEFVNAGDGPTLRLNCLPDQLEAAWELLQLCFLEPRFDNGAFLAVRNARLANVSANVKTEAFRARQAAQSAAWPGFDLENGNFTKELDALTRETARSTFMDFMRVRCNLRFVTVGPIDAERISDLLSTTIEALPQGECSESTPYTTMPLLRQANLVMATGESEALAGIFPGPQASQTDVTAMRLIMHMLARRLRLQLVTRDGVADQVSAGYVDHPPSHNFIEIVGPNAFQCAEFALSELRRLKANGFSEKEVAEGKQSLLAEIALAYESATSLAARLDLAAEIKSLAITGNEDFMLQGSTAKSLHALVNEYLVGISWGIVGDTTRVDRKSLQRL